MEIFSALSVGYHKYSYLCDTLNLSHISEAIASIAYYSLITGLAISVISRRYLRRAP